MALRSQGISYLKLASMDFHHAIALRFDSHAAGRRTSSRRVGVNPVWRDETVRPFFFRWEVFERGWFWEAFSPWVVEDDVIYSDRLDFPEQIFFSMFLSVWSNIRIRFVHLILRGVATFKRVDIFEHWFFTNIADISPIFLNQNYITHNPYVGVSLNGGTPKTPQNDHF